MVSTRLASPVDPVGFSDRERRDRVDPMKLLNLIDRIKSASGASTAPLLRTPPKPVARAS